MNDNQRILQALAERDEPCVLATVVETEGSTYRRAGAKMLAFANGDTVGAISGGCLERDIAERAAKILASGAVSYLVYDATNDDEIFGFGMGCNGVMHVVLEPISGANELICRFLRRCFKERERGVAAMAYEITPAAENAALLAGHRFFMRHGAEEAEDSFGESAFAGRLREFVWNNALATLEHSRSHSTLFEDAAGQARVFFDAVEPARELLIIGAGYDALPIVRYAASLGWRVVLCDYRPAFVEKRRAPEAAAHLEFPRERPEVLFRAVEATPHTAVVVMTHNLEVDAAALGAALATNCGYIGVLGPKDRFKKILAILAENGANTSHEILERVHSPIGLDIGSETVEEVALSIVAEIQAVMNKRAGGFLKRRRERSIHKE
jgi:xanthine/CO dehydrogenase XdhC/CoxF family maturation factor